MGDRSVASSDWVHKPKWRFSSNSKRREGRRYDRTIDSAYKNEVIDMREVTYKAIRYYRNPGSRTAFHFDDAFTYLIVKSPRGQRLHEIRDGLALDDDVRSQDIVTDLSYDSCMISLHIYAAE